MHNFKIGLNLWKPFWDEAYILAVFNDETSKVIFFFLIEFYVQRRYLLSFNFFWLQATPEQVAELTLQALTRHVPPAVPGKTGKFR